jgi:hypothetical protein
MIIALSDEEIDILQAVCPQWSSSTILEKMEQLKLYEMPFVNIVIFLKIFCNCKLKSGEMMGLHKYLSHAGLLSALIKASEYITLTTSFLNLLKFAETLEKEAG